MNSPKPTFDLEGLLSDLPRFIQDIVQADFALQAVPLGRVNQDGTPLPFLFATQIKARLAFQCFRSRKNSFLFGAIKLSKRDQKIGDLRFKTSILPGEQHAITGSHGIQQRLLVPQFLGYQSTGERLIVQSPGQKMVWTFDAGDSKAVIRVKHQDQEFVLGKTDSGAENKYLTHLLRQFTTWNEAKKTSLPIGLSDEAPHQTGGKRLHIADLLQIQKVIFENINGCLEVLKNEGTADNQLPTPLPGNQVLFGGYQLASLQADILTSLDRDGMLVLKGATKDAQQFDVKARLETSAGGSVEVGLLIPDISTQGAIWSSICEGLIEEIEQFKDALVGLYRDKSREDTGSGQHMRPKRTKEKISDEIVVTWLDNHFPRIGSENRSDSRILRSNMRSWFQASFEANQITVVRLEQSGKKDVNLIWLHGVPGAPLAEVLFIAEIELDNYPNVVVKAVGTPEIAGILVPGAFSCFPKTSKYWKYVRDYNCRVMAILAQWFKLTGKSAIETESEHV